MPVIWEADKAKYFFEGLDDPNQIESVKEIRFLAQHIRINQTHFCPQKYREITRMPTKATRK